MKVDVDVKIDTNAIIRDIETGIDKGIKEVSPKIVDLAKRNHRYNDVTGSLSNSTMINQIENGLTLVAKQHYGLYIHEGFKTWAPDKWLEDAINDNMDMILNSLNNHIANELK